MNGNTIAPFNSHVLHWLIIDEQFAWESRGRAPLCPNSCDCGGDRISSACEVASSSYPLNPPVVSDFGVLKGKREECVRRASQHFGGKAGLGGYLDCAAEGNDEDKPSVFNIMSVVNVGTVGESEGFRFADVLQWAIFLTETNLRV